MAIDKASENLAIHLQQIAEGIDEVLTEVAGQPVGFILVVHPFGDTTIQQYISNMDRVDSKDSLKALLDRWEKGRADISALYNPDLPQSKK